MHNDLDREIAKGINSVLSECLSIIQTINDNKFVPHITQQPVDFTGASGTDAVFHVVANNVKGYQWQFKETESGTTWNNTGAAGNKTDTLTIRILDARYAYRFRCAITGLDNSVIYSDVVKMVSPET